MSIIWVVAMVYVSVFLVVGGVVLLRRWRKW